MNITIDKLAAKVQSRIDRRANIITENEFDYVLDKALGDYYSAKQTRIKLKDLEQDQKLDKRILKELQWTSQRRKATNRIISEV